MTNKLYIDTTHCFERGSFDTIEKKYFTVNHIILFFNLQNQNCERTLYSLFLFPNSLYVYKMAPKTITANWYLNCWAKHPTLYLKSSLS